MCCCRERTIALFRSSDTYVTQSRGWLPDAVGGVLWFGAGAAHSTAYVPIFAGMTSSPPNLAWGWSGVFNLSTAYWAHRVVLNIAQIKFEYMISDIRAAQNLLESNSQKIVDSISLQAAKVAVNGRLSDAAIETITKAMTENALVSTRYFVQLSQELLFKYANGNLNYWTARGFQSHALGT